LGSPFELSETGDEVGKDDITHTHEDLVPSPLGLLLVHLNSLVSQRKMTPPHGFIDKPKGKTRNDFALPKDEKEKRKMCRTRANKKGGKREKYCISFQPSLLRVSTSPPPLSLVDYMNAKYLFGILSSAHSLPQSTTGSISGMNDGWTVGWMDGEKATNRRPADQITTTSAHIS
jgi:hypothetical protein